MKTIASCRSSLVASQHRRSAYSAQAFHSQALYSKKSRTGFRLGNRVLLKSITAVFLLAAMVFTNAHAASVDKGYLGALNSDSSLTNDLALSAETLVFTQAVNPSTSGFIGGNGSGQWRFFPNDGSSLASVSGYFIRFDGAPALSGIPAESGTLTIGANNEIEDVWTDRIFSRPVVFVALEDPGLNSAVSIVPTAPITHGNQFLFDIRQATGFDADLEGATLKYFIAEEGWHRLSDGRVLLISSAEVRDTGFSGQTIELGGTFSDAVTVAQLQRPMLYKNSLGFRQLDTIEVYQGATVVSGVGGISSISLRMMQTRDVEEANGSTVYAGRIGFMVLGNLTDMNKRPYWVKDTTTNIRGGSYVTVPSDKFINYPHSAATSPLLNKAACAEDDDVQNYCVYLSMPVDMFSRDKFTTPRFPYVDEDFQPLQMQRTLYSEHDNWDWTAVLENDIISPTLDSDNTTPVTGTLAQLHHNFVADRGWDDYIFDFDTWHWFATYHYNPCTFDSVNTACVDYELGDTILDDHQLHWTASTYYNNSWHRNGDGTTGAVWGGYPDLSVEQRLFSTRDYGRRDSARINEFVSVPSWAANQGAAYLNYDLPGGRFLNFGLSPEYSHYENRGLSNEDILEFHEGASAWQLHAMTLTAWATEYLCHTCGDTDFGEFLDQDS
ncbi:MAG: hypothetical protein R3309_14150, partial [Reinekea sp.]|nr:hypothetical protein [Reinekea sp.]